MFQKFFTNTIVSDFIKALIYNSPLPLCDCVDDGDYIVAGCKYIYKTDIIECIKTGYIFGDYTPPLYPDEYLYPNDDLFIGMGKGFANYIKVGTYNFGEYNPLITEYYKSEYNYYDPKTHIALGRLLRCIKAFYQLDLLPFYNCFNHTIIDNIALEDNGTITDATNDAYKLYAVPIKFNKTYTIAIDCDKPVVLKSVLHGPLGLLKKGVSKNSPTWVSSLKETSITKYDSLNFKKPISYRINTDDKELINRQKYLYILIRLPEQNKSSITVIEGDHTFTGNKIFNKEHLQQITSQEFNNLYISPLGLLQMNDKNSYAFSDVLMQYLLSGVITSSDEIAENITRTQDYLKNLGKVSPQFVWKPTSAFVEKRN